jgi:Fe2+ or Zn2+ uptake regulation protein
MQNLRQEIVDRLVKAGIRPSAQRIAIAQYLAEHLTHPTVEEIYHALHDEYPTLSRTTVYNTLWLLVENGVINAISIDRANSQFDYNIENHAHFRCKRCGKVIDLMMPDFSPQLPDGLKIDNVNVYYDGLCPECASTETRQ